MAKKGMKRPSESQSYSTESNKKRVIPKNDVNPVPEVRSKN